MPHAVLIGAGGILPPTETIDDDALTSFDIATDGIDFWESLEGMRVTVDTPLVVSNTSEFGETDIVASLGVGATGVNERGGITISEGDYNPEKIQLDDRFGGLTGYDPDHSIGDQLASVTGIINYSFEHYELLATRRSRPRSTSTLGDNDTCCAATPTTCRSPPTISKISIPATADKFDLLADDIVYSLGAPDIIGVQEIQDANGAGNGRRPVGPGHRAGADRRDLRQERHPLHLCRDRARRRPIRPAASRAATSATAISTRPTASAWSTGSLEHGRRSGLRHDAPPLVATWSFNGQQVTTINVHFTSRGGSDPLLGATQPPADAGDAARIAQAAAVGDYVNDHLAGDPGQNFAVLGDWNGFYFEEQHTQLTDGGVFTNLAGLLPEEERYSYLFDGNSQLLDNILVTGGLVAGARYDAVHINAEFTGVRPTDHDPQVALLRIATTPHDIVISDASVDENLPAGTVVGTLSATDTPGDVLRFALVDDAGGRFAVDAVDRRRHHDARARLRGRGELRHRRPGDRQRSASRASRR